MTYKPWFFSKKIKINFQIVHDHALRHEDGVEECSYVWGGDYLDLPGNDFSW